MALIIGILVTNVKQKIRAVTAIDNWFAFAAIAVQISFPNPSYHPVQQKGTTSLCFVGRRGSVVGVGVGETKTHVRCTQVITWPRLKASKTEEGTACSTWELTADGTRCLLFKPRSAGVRVRRGPFWLISTTSHSSALTLDLLYLQVSRVWSVGSPWFTWERDRKYPCYC